MSSRDTYKRGHRDGYHGNTHAVNLPIYSQSEYDRGYEAGSCKRLNEASDAEAARIDAEIADNAAQEEFERRLLIAKEKGLLK